MAMTYQLQHRKASQLAHELHEQFQNNFSWYRQLAKLDSDCVETIYQIIREELPLFWWEWSEEKISKEIGYCMFLTYKAYRKTRDLDFQIPAIDITIEEKWQFVLTFDTNDIVVIA